jgi:hypothetical protein
MRISIGNFATASRLSLLGCTAQPVESTGTLANTYISVADVGNVENIALQPLRMTPDRVICVRETPTGSYIPRERCYTRRELDQQADEAHRWISSGGRDGSVVTSEHLAF